MVDRLNISLNPKRKTDYSSGRSKSTRRTQKGEMEYLKGRQMILFPHPTWRTRPKRRRKEGKKLKIGPLMMTCPSMTRKRKEHVTKDEVHIFQLIHAPRITHHWSKRQTSIFHVLQHPLNEFESPRSVCVIAIYLNVHSVLLKIK